ncbi:MAG: hypothetical protein ACRDZW_01450 [Acidimicrobiales bacterium]
MEPGETCLLHLRGDQSPARVEELGTDGLRRVIAGLARDGSLAELAAAIESHVADYRHGPRWDDTAILVRVPWPADRGVSRT